MQNNATHYKTKAIHIQLLGIQNNATTRIQIQDKQLKIKYDVIPCHAIPYHTITHTHNLHHFTSLYITSHRITTHHITLHHIASHRITAYLITWDNLCIYTCPSMHHPCITHASSMHHPFKHYTRIRIFLHNTIYITFHI